MWDTAPRPHGRNVVTLWQLSGLGELSEPRHDPMGLHAGFPGTGGLGVASGAGAAASWGHSSQSGAASSATAVRRQQGPQDALCPCRVPEV